MINLSQTYLEILQKNIFFKGLSLEEINQLLNCLEPTIHKYGKEEMVLDMDELLPGVGIVLSGELFITKITSDGNRVIVGQLLPSDTFGEVAALSNSGKAPASVTSQKVSAVLFFSSANITSREITQCNGYPRFISNTIKLMANKAHLLHQKIDYLIIKSIRGRVCAYLYNQYKQTGKNHIKLPFNRNKLAEYLNITRPALSKELGKMQDDGILDYDGNEIEIIDLDKLVSYL